MPEGTDGRIGLVFRGEGWEDLASTIYLRRSPRSGRPRPG